MSKLQEYLTEQKLDIFFKNINKVVNDAKVYVKKVKPLAADSGAFTKMLRKEFSGPMDAEITKNLDAIEDAYATFFNIANELEILINKCEQAKKRLDLAKKKFPERF
jgi:hypothetical protein